jgi:CDP-paratose 2-epimerase
MKYVITGGCGFLGSNLANEVLARGDTLVIYDNLTRLGSDKNLAWLQSVGTFDFVLGDIQNTQAVEELIKQHQPDVIFHLAGQVAMTTSIANPRNDFEINALGTLNVLEGVRKYAPECLIVYSSTNKVYGDLEQYTYTELAKRYDLPAFPNGLPESTPLSFSSPYGCSKGSADQYMLDYYRVFKLKTVVFRHSSMYGGRQFSTYDQGWVGWFCEQAIKHKEGKAEPFTISGNGKQVRDVLHAEDMIKLYFAAVANKDKAQGEVFNIGGGMKFSLSLLELFDILEKELDTTLTYTVLPPRESDQKVFVADISKAANLLGWTPVVDPTTGLRKMITWTSSKES